MTIIIPTTRQKRFFLVAKRNSEKSTYSRWNRTNGQGRISIGAAIINGNYVISEGHNKTKTHTFQHLHNRKYLNYNAPAPRIHAEVDALIYSRYNDLSGCEIFVYREMADGTLGNCRPCPACMGALKDAGIKHIYYTSEQGYHYEKL